MDEPTWTFCGRWRNLGGFAPPGSAARRPSRVAVHKSVYHEFTSRLSSAPRNCASATASTPMSTWVPAFNEGTTQDGARDYVPNRAERKAPSCFRRQPSSDGALPRAGFMSDDFRRLPARMRVAQEEIFRPGGFGDSDRHLEEAIEGANGVPYVCRRRLHAQREPAFDATREVVQPASCTSNGPHRRRNASPFRRP